MRRHAARNASIEMFCRPVWTPKIVMACERTRGCETAPVPRITVKSTRPDLLDIEYETFGLPDDPALLLVAGFVVQLTSWDAELCELLAAGGRYVIRFDNR